MAKKVNKERASYIPLDAASAVREQGELIQSGETCHVDQLKNTFAWMRGFLNLWTGWANDGKSVMADYLSVLKAVRAKWRVLMLKPEDMDTYRDEAGKVHIGANRIYKNLAWTLTGKTWNKSFSIKYRTPIMTLDEEQDALHMITKHFYILYPEDWRVEALIEEIGYYIELYKIDIVWIDPWNVVKVAKVGRDDENLVYALHDMKTLAMKMDACINIVNHPKVGLDPMDKKTGVFKVVNQFMQLGGSAWDMKMDGIYSVYRPNRHRSPSDPLSELYNLKQKQSEVVGVERGQVNDIMFDKIKRQYYFSNVNPMTGHMLGVPEQSEFDFKNVYDNKDPNKPPF